MGARIPSASRAGVTHLLYSDQQTAAVL